MTWWDKPLSDLLPPKSMTQMARSVTISTLLQTIAHQTTVKVAHLKGGFRQGASPRLLLRQIGLRVRLRSTLLRLIFDVN